jgi:hypothetical protein
MAKVLHVREWVSRVRQFGGSPKRDTVVGVSITLAAWLLGPLSLIGDALWGRGAPSGNQRARNSLHPDFRQSLCHVRGQHSSY